MKRLLLFLLLLALAAPVCAQSSIKEHFHYQPDELGTTEVMIPARQGAFYDYFRHVSPETVAAINTLAKDLKQVTLVDLAVAIVPQTRPMSVEAYGRYLYQEWKMDPDFHGERGVLLVISVLNRRVKIIVGPGMEELFDENTRDRLQWDLFPSVGSGKFAQAAYLGTAMISSIILENWPEYQQLSQLRAILIFILVFTLFVLVTIVLTKVFNGSFFTIFATIIGGMFGLLAFGYFGMYLFAAVGFISNIGEAAPKITRAQREVKGIYDRWKREKEEEEEQNQ